MPGENEWNEKLCDCTKDCGICCYGFWCTPCLFGENAKKISDNNCCAMCFVYFALTECYLCWIPHLMEREKLRKKYNLKEDPCNDCPTTCCCGPCALCQEAREIKFREGQQSGYQQMYNNNTPVLAQPGAYQHMNTNAPYATPPDRYQQPNMNAPFGTQPGVGPYQVQLRY